MKSFLTWIIAVAIGGGIGYGLSFLFGVSLYLLIGAGVLIGNALGITINIHRDDDLDMPPDLPQVEDSESEPESKAAE